MRIAIATDAWTPQPNGVVRVLSTLVGRLEAAGHEVLVISPDGFRTVPLPTYAEIPVALLPRGKTTRLLEAFRPEAVHVATEGTIGQAARKWCLARSLPFTTAYHTKFPEYVTARVPVPLDWVYGWVRKFHAPSSGVLVPSPSVHRELTARGFANLKPWSHGVDTGVFRPGARDYVELPRPVFLYLGRVTVEKNLPAFLDLDLPGSKLVVGSGPAREHLMRRYPEITFRVADGDDELRRYFNVADAFVFPSLTDTFGLVMLEALACGVPVAAFPVTGPADVIGSSGVGVLDEDLGKAALAALQIAGARCRRHALDFSWDQVVEEFLGYLAPISDPPAASRRPPKPRARAVS